MQIDPELRKIAKQICPKFDNLKEKKKRAILEVVKLASMVERQTH